MSNHSKSLVGRPFSATIGEPWDFSSEAGRNVLRGSVVGMSDDGEDPSWIRCTIVPFKAKGPVTEVAFVRRYRLPSSLLTSLTSGDAVTVNILYDPSGKELDAQSIRDALRTRTGLSFLVGSVIIGAFGNE